LPPFELIRAEHFEPALCQAMVLHRAELDTIAAQAAAPTFDNTVAALDQAGTLLARTQAVMYTLAASHTSLALQAVQRAMAAPLAAHASASYMHAGVFARLDALHAQRTELGLSPQALRLLERLHLDHVRAGARMPPPAQQRYEQVMEELAQLTTRFAQNLLHDEREHVLWLDQEADLAGLPDFLRAAAQQAAADRGRPGAHVITLSRSLVVPFLTYSQRRDLRQRAWQAWVQRGEHAGEHDNRDVARRILVLRREQAALHGFAFYADYALSDTMAGRQDAVQGLLQEVWPRALVAVQSEQAFLHAAMAEAGVANPAAELQAWDWRYWAERVRVARFNVDDAEVKPYFELSAMVNAAFDCAARLFGLSFERRSEWPTYHPDVVAYEVSRGGQVLGVFLQDNFARPAKRSGAWMSALRWQSRQGGAVLPIILNNNNFAKGAAGQPTLLSLDDVRTLFHEFGHGLHGLLSQVEYRRLSGTQVLRDFVELPSQLFEHWVMQPEVLAWHAKHVHTGQPMPEELQARLHAARRFNQGYETARYTASALVDMAVHARTGEPPEDLCAYEAQYLAQAGLPAAVGTNHRLVHFQHLFASSGYAAGYYVYLWAEVLDADGFAAFEEAGDVFDAATAARLQRFIYSSGNSLPPQAAYEAFRGRAATVWPLLRKRGLVADDDAPAPGAGVAAAPLPA
jgi:peptidyl-dipeptidase Dcp